MVGIILEGAAADDERKRLLEVGKELPVALRERDADGKKKASWFQFGMNGSTAWIYCRDEEEGREPKIVLEGVLVHEAAGLFRGYLERMELRHCLVDPSPLSAELVEVSSCIEDVVTDLVEEFGVELKM